MFIYKDYIDSAIPLNKKERRRVRYNAWKRWMKRPTNVILYGIGVSTVVLSYLLHPIALDVLFGHRHWSLVLTAYFVYLALLLTLFAILQRYRFAPCIYAELRSMHFDVCPRCGYWLKGLDNTITKCPECGAIRFPIDT